jgi:hypothetical protein
MNMNKSDALRLAAEMDQYLYNVPAHPLCTLAAAELAIIEDLLATPDELARLGNGELPGNSIGNVIAQKALARAKEQR